jgi:glycosyltransferase involved in cell wall biosynthesis
LIVKLTGNQIVVDVLTITKRQYPNNDLIDNQYGLVWRFSLCLLKNGWLVPPGGDVNSLKIAMQELLDTCATDLEVMGKHGFDVAKSQHDIEKEAGKLAGLFTGFVA